MSRGRKSSDEGVISLIAIMLMIAIAIPALGIYWTFKGDTENKRVLGILILIICVIVGIFGMCS